MGCASSVEAALKNVKGVSRASINLKAGKASVEYDPAVAKEQDLVKAVKAAGFGATI
jgi:Cu+-exporting ATPase